MRPIYIYLAGPMDAESKSSMEGWRKKVWQQFDLEVADQHVVILDPCRRLHSDDMTSEEVVLMDFADLDRCDVILVDNRCKPRENTGTSVEMYRAKEKGIPVVAWWDEEHQPKHVRLFMDWLVTKQTHSLQEAIDHIKTFFITNNDTTRSPYHD